MKQIQITVDLDGEVTIKAEGFVGRECKDATLFIEKALGSVTGRTLTGTYYQTKTENRLQQKQEG